MLNELLKELDEVVWLTIWVNDKETHKHVVAFIETAVPDVDKFIDPSKYVVGEMDLHNIAHGYASVHVWLSE